MALIKIFSNIFNFSIISIFYKLKIVVSEQTCLYISEPALT